MKKISIVAGGVLDEILLDRIKQSEFIIGVDRGAWWLFSHGIKPTIAIGDFDSISEDQLKKLEKAHIPVEKYSREKNETDLELAVTFACSKKPERIEIFGVIGSRLDHSLAGVSLLALCFERKISAKIITKTSELILYSGKIILPKSNQYKYISLLSWSEEILVSIRGCKYNGDNIQIKRGESQGVSNEIVEKEAQINISSGIALLIQSRDE
ncbi:thiamine diphosphokinase [Candidatus Gottesmanbacteria bacterium]|nr:thiamine diphosphokinase [Candidatus Gottesmanbacteria bacterium]